MDYLSYKISEKIPIEQGLRPGRIGNAQRGRQACFLDALPGPPVLGKVLLQWCWLMLLAAAAEVLR